MLSTVEGLPDREREVLKVELATKDGFFESPVYILLGAGRFMEAACANRELGARPALVLLARILEDAARSFDRLATLNQRTVTLDLQSLAPHARNWAPGGTPFEDTHFTFHARGNGAVYVEFAGGA